MLKITNNAFFTIGWEKYLAVLFLLLGIGLFSSGSVTWVAANWDYWSKFQKLYATQGLLGLTIVFAVFCYIKEAKHLPKARLKFISASFFFASAVLIGALFALIGQIYQTGADPWQLFALWSILQIPLLLILPNIGSALLLMLTLNVTVILYGIYRNNFMPEFLIGLNFLLLIISEFTSAFFHDKHWRVLSKCANLALASSLIVWIWSDLSFSYMDQNISSFNYLVFGGLIWAYKKYRHDLFPLIVHFIGLIVSLDIFILNHDSLDTGSLFFATVLTLGATIWGAILLKNWFFRDNPTLEYNWAVQLMFAFFSVLATILLVIFILLISDIGNNAFLMTSILLFMAGICLHYYKSNNYCVDMLLAIASILLFIYFIERVNIFRFVLEKESNEYFILAGIVAYTLMVFYLKQTLWLKSLLILLCLTMFLITFNYIFNPDYNHISEEIYSSALHRQLINSAINWLMLGGLICFYFVGKKQKSQLRFNMIPTGWAFILMVLGLFIVQNNDWYFLNATSTPVGELPQVTSMAEFFNVMTANKFSLFNTKYWLSELFYFSVLIAPLILYFALSSRVTLSKPGFWGSAIALAFFCICFSASVIIPFCFALLLLAYSNSSRALFGFAIFTLIGALALYYYMLLIPLLYKSLLLLACGMVFLVVALLLHQWRLPTAQNANEQSEAKTVTGLTSTPITVPILTLVFVTVVLGGAHYTTLKYEDVLENGASIILKTAPEDPRSLMQGDYMVLSYDILNDLNTSINEHDSGSLLSERIDSEESITKIYALIQNDNNGIAKLCRIELNEPTHFDGCQEGIYLPINNTHSGQFQLAGQSYFFPEGKGEYYAQAEYGEYRFKDGKVLLLRLLDKNLKPL